jgi:hypothetical protein
MRSEPQGSSLSSGGSRILGCLPVKDWLGFLTESDELFGLGSVSMGNTYVSNTAFEPLRTGRRGQ